MGCLSNAFASSWEEFRARSVSRLPPPAWWRLQAAHRRRLAITVDKCCDWLQQLPH